jgi:hypothetical protein
MDVTTWLIIGGLALICVIAALVMLKRSWGNFPERAGTLPLAEASAPAASRAPETPAAEQADLSPLGMPEHPAAAIEPAGLADRLVLIEHPLVRRSAEQALERGGPITRYIVRQGDQVYFDFSQIADSEQRREVYDLMRRFNTGQDVDISAMLKMVNRLFK